MINEIAVRINELYPALMMLMLGLVWALCQPGLWKKK